MQYRNALLASTSILIMATGGAWAQSAAPAPAAPAATPAPAAAAAPLRHLVYMALPGDAGADGQSGVLVLDADHNFEPLTRIPYPLPAALLPGPKISGMTASIAANKIYVTTDGGDMYAINLKTDKVDWDFRGVDNDKIPVTIFRPGSAADGCCERPYTLPDGKGGETLLVLSQYNNHAWKIDAKTGDIIARLDLGASGITRTHNLAVSPDGKIAAISALGHDGPNGQDLAIVDMATFKVIKTLQTDSSIRPLTINHDGSLVYLNLNAVDGFAIYDVAQGKIIHTYALPDEMWKAAFNDKNHTFYGHGAASHGIGLTPDESEIWSTDVVNSAWQVWDLSADGRTATYAPLKTIPVQNGDQCKCGSSWMTLSPDAKTAIVGDGSIIDVKSHKVIATIKDEYGRPVHAVEKVLFLNFDDKGNLKEMSNQFAIGDPAAYQARIAKQASATPPTGGTLQPTSATVK
jgi:DNA-binding beta-propeller fold protein YncE